MYEFNSGISSFITTVENELPDFSFKNGELNVEGEIPIYLQYDNNILIIDTSGQLDESVLDKYSISTDIVPENEQ